MRPRRTILWSALGALALGASCSPGADAPGPAPSAGGAGDRVGGAAGQGGASGGSGTSGVSGSLGGGGSGGSDEAPTSGGAAGTSADEMADAGGSPPDAGTSSTGTPDATTGPGPTSSGCASGQVICEDFEQYAAGAAPKGIWTVDARGAGSVQVDTAHVHAGTKSLHITGSVSGDRANITTPIKMTADTSFVRFMMYTAGYPSSSGVHTRLFRLGTAQAAGGGPDTSYSFSSYNGTAIEKVNSIYLRDTTTHLNDDALKNKWACWEFEIDKTGGVGKVTPHIWLNGTERSLSPAGSSTHGMTSNSWDPISFDVFMLGLDGFQNDTVSADFWLDDIVLSSARVGCPP